MLVADAIFFHILKVIIVLQYAVGEDVYHKHIRNLFYRVCPCFVRVHGEHFTDDNIAGYWMNHEIFGRRTISNDTVDDTALNALKHRGKVLKLKSCNRSIHKSSTSLFSQDRCRSSYRLSYIY